MRRAVLRCSLFALAMFVCQFTAMAQEAAKHAIAFDDLIQMHRVGEAQVSPDGKWVAYTVSTPDMDANRGVSNIWIVPTTGGAALQLTQSGHDSSPAWSPDGKTLIFTALVTTGGGNVEIRSKSADGSGPEKTLVEQNNYHSPGWSPDGKYVTYLWGEGEKMVSLWIRPVDGDGKPVAAVQPPSAQSDLISYRVSRDSHWVAYASDESGQQNIYITTFPDGKGKWRVSTNSGAFPAWSENGRELFFKDLTDNIFVCTVTTKGSEIEVGTPQRLFHAASPGIGLSFDAFSDGQRLLVNHSEEEGQVPLQLVTNWPAELKR